MKKTLVAFVLAAFAVSSASFAAEALTPNNMDSAPVVHKSKKKKKARNHAHATKKSKRKHKKKQHAADEGAAAVDGAAPVEGGAAPAPMGQ